VSVLLLRRGWVVGLALAGVACARHGRRPSAALYDDLGHPITLMGPAQRIVSLSPSTTALLFAIGAGPHVVGRTRWDDYPPAATAVPSVGDGLYPNIELVLARRPDLVILYASSANQGAMVRFRSAGIANAGVRLDRLSDVPHAAWLLGRLTGTERRADSLAERFHQALDSARHALPPAARSAVVVAWGDPPIVIGAGSFLTELLALAGVRNVFADVMAPSAPSSLEAITARDPDLLFVLGKTVPAGLSGPAWRAVRAVRTHHVVTLSGSEFEYPSLRAFTAVREIGAAIAHAGSAP
jgi:ABC-type Fe3+-hydroxamate transport system substrate-binding protein